MRRKIEGSDVIRVGDILTINWSTVITGGYNIFYTGRVFDIKAKPFGDDLDVYLDSLLIKVPVLFSRINKKVVHIHLTSPKTSCYYPALSELLQYNINSLGLDKTNEEN